VRAFRIRAQPPGDARATEVGGLPSALGGPLIGSQLEGRGYLLMLATPSFFGWWALAYEAESTEAFEEQGLRCRQRAAPRRLVDEARLEQAVRRGPRERPKVPMPKLAAATKSGVRRQASAIVVFGSLC